MKLNYYGGITLQCAAGLLVIGLCNNGEAMHKKRDGKAVQGAKRLMLLGLVKKATALRKTEPRCGAERGTD